MCSVGQWVPDWLAHRAFTTPNRPAIIEHNHQVTFAELDRRASSTAHQLRELGLSPKQRVAILMNNGTNFAELVNALPRADAVSVPLNTRLTAEELAWQVNDSGCAMLIFDHANEDKARILRSKTHHTICVNISDCQRNFGTHKEAQQHPPPSTFMLDHLHSVLYTSGTTGTPKGVMLTFGNHLWSALSSMLNLGLRPDDRWLACLPFFHVGGLSILMRSVIYGIPVVIHEKFDPGLVNRAIETQRVTITSVVSAMLSRMLEERGAKPYPESLRCILVGGGPVPRSLLEQCYSQNIPIVQTYGLTETASQIVTLSPEDALRKLGSAGKPLFPNELRIKRENSFVTATQEGEIVLRGPSITVGYDGRPHETETSFREGWFHTGDWGYLDEDGYLYVLDRRKDLIISGGENVYPAEVESALMAHPSVLEAGVTGIPDPKWGQVPVAAICIKEGQTLREAALYDFLHTRLAKYKIPVMIKIMEKLPRTASGKLQRHVLQDLFTKESKR